MARNPATVDRGAMSGARIVNIVMGAWLFISAFIWPHTTSQRTNTWIVGLIILGIAALGMKMPQARYANSVVAVWLFISAFILPVATAGTVWNNVIVAIVVFAASMVGYTSTTGGRRMRTARA